MSTLKGSIIAGLAAVTLSSAAYGQNTLPCGEDYVVASGDNLAVIALRAYGSSAFASLYAANVGVIGPDPNRLKIGQVLSIPCAAATTTPIARATTNEASQVDATLPDGTLVLTFNKTSAPPFIINKNMIDLFLAEITEVTDGRVRFVDPEVVNRDEAAQFDLVTSGQVDGAYVLNSHLDQTHPLLQLPMLPLMGGSAEQTATALWRLHAEHLSTTAYFDQAKLLGFVAAPAAHIWRLAEAPVTADEGIAYANDYPVPYFLGLDQRGPVVLRQEVAEMQAAYDAKYMMPPTYFLAHGAARAVGIWTEDVQVTEVDNGLYTPTFSVILSNDAWDQISPADQAAIEAVSGQRLASRSVSWDAFDNGFREDMLVNGLNFVKADAALLADLQERTDEGIKAWSAEASSLGIPAADAVASYVGTLRELEDRLLFR